VFETVGGKVLVLESPRFMRNGDVALAKGTPFARALSPASCRDELGGRRLRPTFPRGANAYTGAQSVTP